MCLFVVLSKKFSGLARRAFVGCTLTFLCTQKGRVGNLCLLFSKQWFTTWLIVVMCYVSLQGPRSQGAPEGNTETMATKLAGLRHHGENKKYNLCICFLQSLFQYISHFMRKKNQPTWPCFLAKWAGQVKGCVYTHTCSLEQVWVFRFLGRWKFSPVPRNSCQYSFS